jgi:hypothetical protein
MQRTPMAHGLKSSLILSLILAIGLSLKVSLMSLIVIINAFIDIYAFNYLRLKINKMKAKDITLIVMLLIPYVLFVKLNIYLALPIILLITYVGSSLKRKHVISNISGSSFLSSMSLVWLSMISNIVVYQFIIIFSWIMFTLTLALIVEYKLPFRNIVKIKAIGYTLPLILMAVILTYLISRNYYLLGLYLFPLIALFSLGNKINNIKEIKKIGKIGMYSSVLFVLLSILMYRLLII